MYASGDHETQVDYILFRKGLRKHIRDVKVIPGEECLTQHRLLVCISRYSVHALETWRSVLSLPQILEITTDPWNCKQHIQRCLSGSLGHSETGIFCWTCLYFAICLSPAAYSIRDLSIPASPLSRDWILRQQAVTRHNAFLHAAVILVLISHIHMWSVWLDTSF